MHLMYGALAFTNAHVNLNESNVRARELSDFSDSGIDSVCYFRYTSVMSSVLSGLIFMLFWFLYGVYSVNEPGILFASALIQVFITIPSTIGWFWYSFYGNQYIPLLGPQEV
jgi:hypothetical protein